MSRKQFLCRFSKFRSISQPKYYSTEATSSAEVKIVETDDDNPLYPPIKGKFPPGNWENSFNDRKVAWKWHELGEKIKEIPSANDRLKYLSDKIDKSRFGRKVWHYKALDTITPNLLQYQLNKTKTINICGQPDIYKKVVISEDDIKLATSIVHDAVHLSKDVALGKSKTSMIDPGAEFECHVFLRHLLLNLSSAFVHKCPHYFTSQFDENVTVEASWDRYGCKPFPPLKTELKQHCLPFEAHHFELVSHYDCSFKADFLFRSDQPLPEFIAVDDSQCTEGEYPEFKYWPATVGQGSRFLKRSFVPGFKLGDPCEFPTLMVQRFGYQNKLKVFKSHPHVLRDMEIGYGVNCGFVMGLAMAHYQGFNTYIDTTYPFTNQTIITDGRHFSFHAYQLNTLCLWKSDVDHPTRNIGWYTEPTPLYETFEDGKVQGLNTDVLKQLLQVICLAPEPRGYDLKPTLWEKPEREKIEKYVEETVVEEEIVFDQS